MAIAFAPYYWLTCDAQGCLTRYPDQDDCANAWDEVDGLTGLAREAEWHISDAGTHWCPEHAAHWWCADCSDDLPEPIADPEQRICTACRGDAT